jgi:DNA polymerase (family 10)
MGAGVLDLLRIRGVGVKTVGRFYQELGVKSLDELRMAIEDGRLKEMKRMGAKTIASIDEGLRFLEAQQQVRPLRQVLPIVQTVFDELERCPAINRLDFTGDLRRCEEMLQSLELTAECTNPKAIVEALTAMDEVDSAHLIEGLDMETIQAEQEHLTEKNGDSIPQTHIFATVDGGFPLRVYPLNAATYEAGLLITTGSVLHVAKINQIAVAQDLESLCPPPDWANSATEADIYGKIGLPFIVPELRRDADSVEAALNGNLPTLIELSDLCGDLHMHTSWSDGRQSIHEMIEAAKGFGYEYMAITDHSESSTVANGLTAERLVNQIAQVREANAEIDGIEVFTGSEVDIRSDGTLDFPDEILAQLDIVIASVHAGFSMSEIEMTERVIKTIENPFVKIIGHLTGRLLGHRPGYAINVDAVISAAAKNHVALEINASPSRLDIEPSTARKARDSGVLLCINTDSHATVSLERMGFGINVARRGWVEKENVINTYPLEALREILDISN